ncbi:MAG TPA: MBL fold metallo-hydrolase [Motilibacterales bacterium]|nr:MBL fold metallo-hydrolase [Motilibacterales bacterium]
MRLTFLGVRGSTPAPGPDFVRYGGHTSCVVVAPDAASAPVLALDAGTGIRSLTALLDGRAFDGSILLSHLHWDHVQGIPFFGAADRDDSRVDVHIPEESGRSGFDLLAQMMSPPAFPITPEGLKGTWTFNAIDAGPMTLEGFEVTAFDVAHKGGRTYGYRVEAGGTSIAYVPDHAPAAGVSDEAMAAMHGVDVLIEDAQFLTRERPRAVDYGHATIDEAITLGREVSAKSLVLFHHGPHRVDDALDRIRDEFCSDGFASVAYEGMVLDLP